MGVNSGDVMFGDKMPCLPEKAEGIVRDPDAHLDKCRVFGDNYRRWAPHFELLRTLELLRAQLVEMPSRQSTDYRATSAYTFR